jgi:uncharacterized protein YjbI with pentapeptide repeats
MSRQSLAQALYDDLQTPEGWAWARIKQGKEADFNERCETPGLSPRSSDESRWTEGCRRISGTFLSDLLTDTSLRNLVPFAGIRIVGARIESEINLQNVKFDRALVIEKSLIQGDVNLNAAQAEAIVAFFDSSIEGNFDAWQLHCKLSLVLEHTEFKKDVMLNGARIEGYLSTEGADFGEGLDAGSLQIGGNWSMRTAEHNKDVILNSARIAGNVYMDGAMFHGNINADSLAIGASLFMRSTKENRASFRGMILRNASVAGSIQMDGATFSETLNADALKVGVSLFMRSGAQHKAHFRTVILDSARITGNVDMDGATFDGDFSAFSLQVGGSLVMRSAQLNANFILIGGRIGDNFEMGEASFKRVSLRGANVTRNVIIEGATFKDDVDAGALQVGASLFMRSTEEHHFQGLNLSSAKVAGDINLDGATFDGRVSANALYVGASLAMRNVVATRAIQMNFTQVSGNFDMRGSTLADLDLSGSTIGGDFRLDGPTAPYENTFWRIKEHDFGRLRLRNTRVTNLMDSKYAWPEPGYLELDGFRFTHLGGYDSDGDPGLLAGRSRNNGTEQEMRDRGMKWWDSWVQRDTSNSPTPYEQLSAALIATGDREAADEIRYLGRVQQRKRENWPSWIFSGFLQYAAGFGIGDRTFRVLYWVLAISAAGAMYLMKCVPTARKRGALWCFGASFSRILPAIELNKEFTDFFHDPKRSRLSDGQVFVFSTMGVVGWVLGAILVAAVSGLTQKP